MSIHIRTYTFNPFQENTYLIHDDQNNAVIVDPGCYTAQEREVLDEFIQNNDLKIHAILNTHCHIDHVLGNAHLARTYSVDIIAHEGELSTLSMVGPSAQLYGFTGYEPSPLPTIFVEEGDELTFGEIRFKVIFAPGHSIAHIAFYNEENAVLMGGDILFKGSFGRYDLPGGSLETLKNSIRTKIFTLPENTVVYPGHGPETTIGSEKSSNPILHY
ncbi:MAG: MBL fold metallo-hydrolase [Flavobacteriia bacterium]|nr:MBL fold metallo-hydrolase [Flavobacteriia bacterium]OJX35298.1 MAG: MBL fold hydrolase [Flavobacteriia bacterium 40-80]